MMVGFRLGQEMRSISQLNIHVMMRDQMCELSRIVRIQFTRSKGMKDDQFSRDDDRLHLLLIGLIELSNEEKKKTLASKSQITNSHIHRVSEENAI